MVLEGGGGVVRRLSFDSYWSCFCVKLRRQVLVSFCKTNCTNRYKVEFEFLTEMVLKIKAGIHKLKKNKNYLKILVPRRVARSRFRPLESQELQI
jgi:hypothetical protein